MIVWQKSDRTIFMRRSLEAFNTIKKSAAEKRWKKGRRAGTIRKIAEPVHFNVEELRNWILNHFAPKQQFAPVDVPLTASSCPYCGRAVTIKNFAVDHDLPRKRGGIHHLDNLVLCDADCNTEKGICTRDEFIWLKNTLYAALPAMVADNIFARMRVGEVQRMRWFISQGKAVHQ